MVALVVSVIAAAVLFPFAARSQANSTQFSERTWSWRVLLYLLGGCLLFAFAALSALDASGEALRSHPGTVVRTTAGLAVVLFIVSALVVVPLSRLWLRLSGARHNKALERSRDG